jgi:hypothetical protein
VSYLPSSSESPSMDSLRESLRDAQRRLAYFERFGTLIQEQMGAVVERATQKAQENERERGLLTDEVGRLRAEAELLRRQAEYQRSQAEATISRANQDAAALFRQVHEAMDALVQTMVSRLISLQGEVQAGEPSPGATSQSAPSSGGGLSPAPPPPGLVTTTYETPSAGNSNGADQVMVPTVAAPHPPPALSVHVEQPAAAAPVTSITTRLVVRPVMSYEELIRFQHGLREQTGIEHVEVSAISDERCEMVISHRSDAPLEMSLMQMPGRPLRVTGRGDDVVEVEVTELGAAHA